MITLILLIRLGENGSKEQVLRVVIVNSLAKDTDSGLILSVVLYSRNYFL